MVLCDCSAIGFGKAFAQPYTVLEKPWLATLNTHSETLIFSPPMHIGSVHSFWASRSMNSFSFQLKSHNVPRVKHSSYGKFDFLFIF